MTGIKAKTGGGALFEAELYRNGKLVPDSPAKKKNRFMVRKIPGGVMTIKLIPEREKENAK